MTGKKNSFSWIVELDDGRATVVADNLPPEFLIDLGRSIGNALSSRDDLIGKKRAESVPVPKKLMRGMRNGKK